MTFLFTTLLPQDVHTGPLVVCKMEDQFKMISRQPGHPQWGRFIATIKQNFEHKAIKQVLVTADHK